MNWFLKIIGIGTPKPPVVTPPAPVPPPALSDPAPGSPPPAGVPPGTTIAIRGNFSGVFYPQAVPFRSTEPVAASQLGKKKWLVEVTVLTGELTITDLYTAKLHSPKFSGVTEGFTYLAGERFTAKLTLGPKGITNSTYSYTMWGIHTKELGEIVNIQAQVANSK